MAAPTYDWVCQRCGNENCAHVEDCGGCGQPAKFKATDLPAPTPSAQASEGGSGGLGSTLMLLFPEAIPALLLAIYGPFWALGKLAGGDVWPALALLLAEALCGYLFVRMLSQGFKTAAYASMCAFTAVAILVVVWS